MKFNFRRYCYTVRALLNITLVNVEAQFQATIRMEASQEIIHCF